MSAPQNTPYQDAHGRWCCPRCGAARFSNRMEVLGHFRACKPGEPFLPRPRYHAPVASPPPSSAPVVVAPTATALADGLVVSSISEPELFGSIAALRAEVAEVRALQGNHLAHMSAQVAGGGGGVGGWKGWGAKLAVGGAIAAVPVLLALMGGAGGALSGRRTVPLVVTRKAPSKAYSYGGRATCDASGNCADDPRGNCDCDAEGRCVCEFSQGDSSSSSSSRGRSLLGTAKDALSVVGSVKKLVG